MNFTNKRTVVILVTVIALVAYLYLNRPEKYSGRTDYRYGFVDTNPARRVSDAFDSPEHKNVHEGLPLP